MAAFKAKDEAAIEKLAGEVTDEEPIAENDLTGTSGQHIHVHVNSGTGGDGATKDEEEGGEGDKDDPFKKIADSIGALTKSVGDLCGRMDAYDKATTTDADGGDDDDTSTKGADGDDDDKDGDKSKTKDGKSKTRDSAHLADSFKDAVARAEILSPGIKVPTYDKKADATKTLDAICGFRRKVLDKAYATEDGKVVIDAITGSTQLKTKDMTCDAAKLLFNAASEATKAANRASATGSSRFHDGDIGTKKPATIADMNSKATDFWKPKA